MTINIKNFIRSKVQEAIKILTFFVFFLAYANLNSQSIDDYIHKAWAANHNIQAKEFEIQAAEASFKEAKSLYGPTASFNTQYSLAAGGRNIEFPIGDLLNPVYASLNRLESGNNFPVLQNQEINFLPNNFYDAKLSIQQSIYYPELDINKNINYHQLNIKNLELKAFKRLLSKEVMNLSYNLFSAAELLNIYKESNKLLLEAKRTTTSMIVNGIALPSALSRIESQIANNNSRIIDVANNINNIQAYFKHLTGDTMIIFDKEMDMPLAKLIASNTREELQQLEEIDKINAMLQKKEGSFYKPKIGVQLDLGSQAFNFAVSPYALLGLNINFNLFDNKRHKHRMDHVRALGMALDAKKTNTQKEIDLQSQINENNLSAAINQANTFPARIKSVNKIYDDVFLMYKEGRTSYLELLDAETQQTQTKIQFQLAKLNAWLKWSELLYSTASYKIE